MKKCLFVLLIFLFIPLHAFCLLSLDGNLIFDSDQNLYWIPDGNYSGFKNNADARLWADTLEYAGHDDYRLPTWQEMKYLFEVYSVSRFNQGLFFNIDNGGYWALNNDSPISSHTWAFNFEWGGETLTYKTSTLYSFAVMDVKDVVADPVPEPATILLLGIGILAIGIQARRVTPCP